VKFVCKKFQIQNIDNQAAEQRILPLFIGFPKKLPKQTGNFLSKPGKKKLLAQHLHYYYNQHE
jgi:hypothetical protein